MTVRHQRIGETVYGRVVRPSATAQEALLRDALGVAEVRLHGLGGESRTYRVGGVTWSLEQCGDLVPIDGTHPAEWKEEAAENAGVVAEALDDSQRAMRRAGCSKTWPSV